MTMFWYVKLCLLWILQMRATHDVIFKIENSRINGYGPRIIQIVIVL